MNNDLSKPSWNDGWKEFLFPVTFEKAHYTEKDQEIKSKK